MGLRLSVSPRRLGVSKPVFLSPLLASSLPFKLLAHHFHSVLFLHLALSSLISMRLISLTLIRPPQKQQQRWLHPLPTLFPLLEQDLDDFCAWCDTGISPAVH